MFRSKSTAYAILGATEVARRQSDAASPPVLVAEIASQFELPTAYFGKVMSQLAKAHVLQSDRGPRGGFRLSRPAKKITLLEIYEAAEGPVEPGDARDAPEPIRKNINAALALATTAISKRLAMTTLADLMRK